MILSKTGINLATFEERMDALKHAPAWLLRPVPTNAVVDDKLHARLQLLSAGLPYSLPEMHQALEAVKMYAEYDLAANYAAALVWSEIDRIYTCEDQEVRQALLYFATEHMSEHAQAPILRRMVKDSSMAIRGRAATLLKRSRIREVALPADGKEEWSQEGWRQGTINRGLNRHQQSQKVLKERGFPALKNIGDLRELLGIRSSKQLGYFLLASEKNDGPYARFEIPKRDGRERIICAPKPQLRWVQRAILHEILDKVPVHDAAHGFIQGRSTVTNAKVHCKAKTLLKFDLTDFFPSIHFYRVVGLFGSLGYYVEDTRFGTEDDSRQVAPTLARLCCYSPDPHKWGAAVMPQGAPTSPAISNLVCRRLDARLQGLAESCKGKYTRYADDLTFSFKRKNVEVGRFRWWVDQICHQEGFFVNQKKFRVIRASQRQTVTGIVVNDELRVPREERRRFRAVLHNCERQGLESQRRGRADFESWLLGFASYLNMIDPKEGGAMLKRAQALCGKEGEDGQA